MPRVRTFVGIDPGPVIRERMLALQEKLAQTQAKIKWVERDNLHVTLLFLGEIEDRQLPAVCRALEEGAQQHQAIPISIEGTGCFPNLRRPRILWLGVGQGAAEVCALHDSLEESLLNLGCYRREERRFTPHVTLGRIRSEHLPTTFASALLAKKDYKAGEMITREVLVMSSDLSSKGPIYTVMSRAPLAKAKP